MIGASLAMAGTLAATPAAVPSCRTADSRVEALIAAKAHEIGGNEYCQFRRYETMSDVDGDGVDDFVVVFGVEGRGSGGNDVVEFLAVFASRSAWEPRLAECGRRGMRLVDEIESARDGTVVLSTSVYLEKDPICCPSGEGRVVFRLEKDRLVEIAPPPVPRD